MSEQQSTQRPEREKVTTKVVFVQDKRDGQVVAVFPELPHNPETGTLTMYHEGQHVSGDVLWARNQWEPSLTAVAPVFNELRDRGYDLVLGTWRDLLP